MHAYIISELKKEMPSVFGKDNKKKELIKRLESIYQKIQREHQISPGDFPDIKRMQVGFFSYLPTYLEFDEVVFLEVIKLLDYLQRPPPPKEYFHAPSHNQSLGGSSGKV